MGMARPDDLSKPQRVPRQSGLALASDALLKPWPFVSGMGAHVTRPTSHI